MKQFIFLIGFLSLSLTVLAQEAKADNWFTNVEEAKTYAQENDKQILMVFAGSDWCRPCIKFKKSILNSDEFKAYSKNNLVILYLDFPARRKNKLSKEATAHNESLAEKYNKSGAFPAIKLFSSEMEILKTLSFDGESANEFIELL